MPRSLLLLSRAPWPPVGGDRVRTGLLVRALGELGPVDVVAVAGPDDDPSAIRDALPAIDRLELVPLRRPAALGRTLRALRDGSPLQQALYDERAAREATARLEREADLVVAHLLRTLPWLGPRRPGGPPRIVALQDALSLQYGGLVGFAGGWRAIAGRLERDAVARAEQAALEQADAVTFISARDRDAVLAGRAAPPAAVVPAAVDLRRFVPPPEDAPRRGIVFAGNLRTASNRDMVQHFAGRVLPLVRSAVRDAELRVVGVEAPRAVRRLGERPGVRFVGPVDDMAGELGRAAVAVCPLRFGSGVQNKVLEALAVQTPTVVTPAAAEGLGTPGGPGTGIRVAELDRSFAMRVVELLQDPAGARAEGREGRRWVSRHHAPERATEELLRLARSLLRGPA